MANNTGIIDPALEEGKVEVTGLTKAGEQESLYSRYHDMLYPLLYELHTTDDPKRRMELQSEIALAKKDFIDDNDIGVQETALYDNELGSFLIRSTKTKEDESPPSQASLNEASRTAAFARVGLDIAKAGVSLDQIKSGKNALEALKMPEYPSAPPQYRPSELLPEQITATKKLATGVDVATQAAYDKAAMDAYARLKQVGTNLGTPGASGALLQSGILGIQGVQQQQAGQQQRIRLSANQQLNQLATQEASEQGRIYRSGMDQYDYRLGKYEQELGEFERGRSVATTLEAKGRENLFKTAEGVPYSAYLMSYYNDYDANLNRRPRQRVR